MNILVGMEGQTAPESTHGLFDTPENVINVRREKIADKRRSVELAPRSISNTSQLYSNQKTLQNHSNELHTVKEEDQQSNQTSSSFFHSPFQRKQRASVAHFNSFPGKILIDTTDDGEEAVAPLTREDVLAETVAKLSGQNRHKTATWQNESFTDIHRIKNNMYMGHSNAGNPESAGKANRRLSEPFTKAYHYSSNNSNTIHQQLQLQQQNPSDFRLFPNSTINKRMSFQSYEASSSSHQRLYNRRRLSMSRLNMSDYENTNQSTRDLNWRSKSPSPSPPAIVGSGTRMAMTNPSSRTSSRPNSMILGFGNNNHRLSTGSIFQQQSNNNNNGSSLQRKPLFVSHLPFSAIVPHLKSNQLMSGLLRVNKRNRSDAYVFCEELNADIYICGSRDRNRALEGDFVAVKLTEVEQVLMEKREKEEAKLVRNNGIPVLRKPDEEDEKEIIFGGEEDVDRVPPKYCGIIVAILERAQNQVFSGTLGVTRPSNKRSKEADADSRRESGAPRIIWFKPTDKRVPLIAIPIEQAPPGFIENSDAFENRLFLGSIKRWPITSLHPFGVLEAELGNTGDPSVQIKAILADNNFMTDRAFSNSDIDTSTLPIDLLSEESIDKEITYNSRRDLRSIRCIAVVDEVGGYSENALSITSREDGDSFEVGFHVSDLSHFIHPDSRLDTEARRRGVDVHCTMAEKVCLWPAALRENCTDLVEGKDRYALSVFWKISKTKGILETSLNRTVINTNIVMSPQELQRAITAPNNTADEITQDIKLLYSIACMLKQAHPQEPLQLEIPELEIHFEDSQFPSFALPKTHFESEVILHEFRTLANTYVAQKISSHFPEHALLRSQARPNDRKLKELTRYLSSLGYYIQPETPESLQQSIDSIRNQDAKNVIVSLIMKTMSPEKYFCTGALDISRYYHYSKNTPLYTHFASPSKRYADVIVHRQLDAYIRGIDEFYMDTEAVQKLAQQCNTRMRLAENAKEQIKHMFLSYYLANNSEHSTNRLEDAIVVGVQDDSFDVVVPGLVLERRIHTVNLPLQSATYNKTENVLHLVWFQGKATVDASIETEIASDEDEDDEYHLRDTHSARDEDSQTSISDLIDLSSEECDNTLMQVKHLSIKSSSTTALDDLKKKRKRSTSIRAVNGEDACLTQKNCTFANECRQVIRPFDFIKVVITAEPVRSPPLIRVLAANPFILKP